MPLRLFRTSFLALAVPAALALGMAALLAAAGPAHAQSYGNDGYQDDRYGDSDVQPSQGDDRYGTYEDYDSEYRSGDRRYGSEDRERDDWDDYEDGEDVPDVGYFHDELGEDGRWVSHPRYGDVWVPRGVDEDWRPYTRGHWANTEEHGWYWVSDEPFGWATYHYGRWHFDDRYGWVWVPGTRWGPAWVAWRESDEYVGWAPLPPDAYWEPSYGLRYNNAIYDSPAFSIYWSFITPALFTSPRLYRHCVPHHQTTTIIYRTRPHTNYVRANRRIVNRGVSVSLIERATRTRLAAVRLNTSDNQQFRRGYRQDGNVLNVFRPKLTRVAVPRAAKPASPADARRKVWDVDRMKLRPARAVPGQNAPRNAAPITRPPTSKAARAPFDSPPARQTTPPSYGNAPDTKARARAANPWQNLNTNEREKLKAIDRARLNAARSKAVRERTTANPAHRLPPPRQGNRPLDQKSSRALNSVAPPPSARVAPTDTIAPPAARTAPPPTPQPAATPVNKPKPAAAAKDKDKDAADPRGRAQGRQ